MKLYNMNLIILKIIIHNYTIFKANTVVLNHYPYLYYCYQVLDYLKYLQNNYNKI